MLAYAKRPRSVSLSALAFIALLSLSAAQAATPQISGDSLRPMTFMDVQLLRRASAPTPSPDGRWALYTVTTPD